MSLVHGFNMCFSEKCFLLVLGGFLASVTYGLGYQFIFDDVALATTLLPMFISISVVHMLGVWYQKEHDIGTLWLALLIWLYFPLTVALGFLTAALGCDEGIVTPANIDSPFLLAASALNVLTASTITVQFLRARESDALARILPFILKSGGFQLVLGPLLMITFYTSK